jgi:hypothetical protein
LVFGLRKDYNTLVSSVQQRLIKCFMHLKRKKTSYKNLVFSREIVVI